MSKPYRPGSFSLEDSPAFSGYTADEQWNGAVPYFEKAEADKVAQYITQEPTLEDMAIHYDEKRDTFIIHDPDYSDDEEDVAVGMDIEVAGKTVHVYGVGARFFTWTERESA